MNTINTPMTFPGTKVNHTLTNTSTRRLGMRIFTIRMFTIGTPIESAVS